MVILQATWEVSPSHRDRVIRALRRLLEPTRALGGCVGCHLWADEEDQNRITYCEEWMDRPALDAHMRDGRIDVLLSAIDFAKAEPRVRIHSVEDVQGLRAIAKARRIRIDDKVAGEAEVERCSDDELENQP